jgi:hypothetical protein
MTRSESKQAMLRVWALDIADGQIKSIRSIVSPDKLTHLGRFPPPVVWR